MVRLGNRAALLSLLALSAPSIGSATEDGRNTYLLGFSGLQAGVVPAPGIYVSNLTYGYGGSAGGGVEFQRGGQIQTDVEAEALMQIPIATYVLPQRVVGGNVGFSLALPYGYTDASADLTLSGPRGRRIGFDRHDDVFAMGDPQAAAFIGWHGEDVHGKIYTLVNVPLGQWSQTNLANIGFNHWSVDVGGAFTWLDKGTGVEVSTTLGVTYNFKNDESDYKSGSEFHLEYAIAKHFGESPLTMGVNGYYYKQIDGDSGSGARAGSFKGEVAAIGPVVNYAVVVGEQPVVVEAKFYHEFFATNRLEGNAGMLSLTFPIP